MRNPRMNLALIQNPDVLYSVTLNIITVMVCWLRACLLWWSAGCVWLVLTRYKGNAGKLEVKLQVIPTHNAVWKHFPEGNHNTHWQIFIYLSLFREQSLHCFTVMFNVWKENILSLSLSGLTCLSLTAFILFFC